MLVRSKVVAVLGIFEVGGAGSTPATSTNFLLDFSSNNKKINTLCSQTCSKVVAV